MNRPAFRKHSFEPLPLDEAWWAAIMAEEETREEGSSQRANHFTQPRGKTPASHPTARVGTINWRRARLIFERDETVCLQVVGYNRGGLLVEGEGIQGFVPVSHLLDLSPQTGEDDVSNDDLSSQLVSYGGRTLRLKVIECDPQRGRIVLSERAALAEPGRRNILLNELKQGDCVYGTVTNITDFGVFVDLGGLEGLVHVSELSWGRVRHPCDAVKVGDEVRAHVIQVDKERSRVALSLKRLYPNPWETAEERYHPGQEVEAVITCIVQYGAFARLEEGLDGLIHITEMKLGSENAGPDDILHEGQRIKVRVLHVDAVRQRLGLSLAEP